MIEYVNCEYLIINALNLIPYFFLFLLTFRNNFRFNTITTITLIFLFLLLSIASHNIAIYTQGSTNEIISFFSFFIILIFALIIVKAKVGKILFLAIMLKNCADYITVVSKYIEHAIWQNKALEIYSWTYALTMLICETVFLSLVFLIIKKHFIVKELDAVNSLCWLFIWIIPLFFYYTWINVFYFTNDSSLQAALQFRNVIFLSISMICQLVMYTCLAIMAEKIQSTNNLKEQLHAHELQKLQYENISLKVEQTKLLSHDLRHHFVVLSSFANNNNISALKQYMDTQIKNMSINTKIKYCDNVPLNILLSYYSDRCSEDDIEFLAYINIPEKIILNDYETTILFGNLIENAYEACLRQNDTKREILVICRIIKNNLMIIIENTDSPNYTFKDSDIILSSKRCEQGLGIKSCKNIISKYSGKISFEHFNRFTVKIMIPS